MIKDGVLIRDYQKMTLKIPLYAKQNLGEDCFIIANNFDETTFSSGTLFKTMLVSHFIPYFKQNQERIDPNGCYLYYEGMGCKGPIKDIILEKKCKLMHKSFNLVPLISHKSSLNYNIYRIKLKNN
jgi:hypothetical protein